MGTGRKGVACLSDVGRKSTAARGGSVGMGQWRHVGGQAHARAGPAPGPDPSATHAPSAPCEPTMKPNLSMRRSAKPLASESEPSELSSSAVAASGPWARLSRVPDRLPPAAGARGPFSRLLFAILAAPATRAPAATSAASAARPPPTLPTPRPRAAPIGCRKAGGGSPGSSHHAPNGCRGPRAQPLLQAGANWTDVRGRDNRHQGPSFPGCQSRELTWTSSSGFSGLALGWRVTCCGSREEGPGLPRRSCPPPLPWPAPCETGSWVGLLRPFILKNSDETQVGLGI